MMTKEEFTRLKLSTRKSWAVQATRWMAEIPQLLLSMCVRKNAAKKELKAWCLKNIPTTGDIILRGRNLEEGRPEAGNRHAGGQDGPGGGCGQEKRQQQRMKKWMQGHQEPQTRRGEQEQTKNKNHGRKRPKQQNTGKEQVQPEQNYSSVQMVQSHKVQQLTKVRDGKTKSVRVERKYQHKMNIEVKCSKMTVTSRKDTGEE